MHLALSQIHLSLAPRYIQGFKVSQSLLQTFIPVAQDYCTPWWLVVGNKSIIGPGSGSDSFRTSWLKVHARAHDRGPFIASIGLNQAVLPSTVIRSRVGVK